MSKDREQGPFEQVGGLIGGTVGRMAGRANDMAINAFGSVLGSAVRQMGEWWSSPDAQRAWNSFGEREDRACREHHQARSPGGSSAAADYESARTAYRFGHAAGQNPEFRTKPFDQVEADLEKAWQASARESHGDWTDVRDRVSFGYTYREPGAPNPS